MYAILETVAAKGAVDKVNHGKATDLTESEAELIRILKDMAA